MPHLWMPHANGWQPLPLVGDRFLLTGPEPAALQSIPAESSPGSTDGLRLLRIADGDGPPAWLLLSPSRRTVRVNGQALPLGARVLRDKDELRFAGSAPLYFSAEELTVVEAYPGPHTVDCPRCLQPIEPGTEAVRCTGCRLWYHQRPDRSCFTYAEACTTCGAETRLIEELQWNPESL